MGYHYAYNQYDSERMARASGQNLPVSLKKTVETADALQGMKVDKALVYLEEVMGKKRPVPYKRFNQEMPHQRGKGIASGGYPYNVAKTLHKLLKSAKNNAAEKELDGNELRVLSVSARKGVARYRTGRFIGQQMKSTHVEIVVGVKQ